MKKLLLVRHAKSNKEGAAFSDQDRPLAERGRRDLDKMGKRLAKHGVKPDLILSSPALRALATADAIARQLDCKHDIVVNDELYASQADGLLEVIHGLDDKLKYVMLVGHNPALDELAHRLSNKIDHLPTCAIAKFNFAAESWSSIGQTKPEKVTLDYPKKT